MCISAREVHNNAPNVRPNVLQLTVVPVLAFALLFPAYLQGTVRAVFAPVGQGYKTMPADTACLLCCGLPAFKLRLQKHVPRQYGLTEPVTAYAVAVHLPARLVAEDTDVLVVVVIGTFGSDEFADRDGI